VLTVFITAFIFPSIRKIEQTQCGMITNRAFSGRQQTQWAAMLIGLRGWAFIARHPLWCNNTGRCHYQWN